MTKQIVYGNGLRLVLFPMPSVRSVTTGVWVGAGSAYENDANNGISHLIEHMMFKGTERRSAFEIAEEMDAIGAQINAFTAKEYTCYYTKSVDGDVERCFDLLSDMLYHSKFDSEELAREKQVVLEEISMTEDSPEDVCHELLSTSMFGASSTYGRTILGPADVVGGIAREDILSYLAARYVPTNIVVSVAGHITEEQADALMRRYFDTQTTSAPVAEIVTCPRRPRNILTKHKSVEQTSVSIGFPSLRYDDPALYALQAGAMCLGGSMSSRLFQEVREKKGLAYSVYSFLSSAKTDGTFTLYCGTTPSKTRAAVETMAEVVRTLKEEGLSQAEFERGKAQIRGNFVMGQESSYSIMSSIGKYMLQKNEVYDLDEALARIEGATCEECNRVLREVLDFDRACMATVGPEADESLLDCAKN